MEQKKPMSLEQIRAFMAASEEIRFEGRNRKEIYNWVRQTVIEQQYHLQGKAGPVATTADAKGIFPEEGVVGLREREDGP